MIAKHSKSLMGIIGLLMAFSVLTGVEAAWIMGKAKVAQYLLAASWKDSLEQGHTKKPWAWADVQTIAKISIPAARKTLIVLNDASGEAMAFGPGLVAGSPEHAMSSTLAIGGHRDTHMRFLEHLPLDSIISLDTIEHRNLHYRLLDKQIVDTRKQTLAISQQLPGLVLITCYPFNAAQTGGPLRLVARAILTNPTIDEQDVIFQSKPEDKSAGQWL
ncbi:MAG: class GN sortase [Granulosicoccus sp.]